MLLCRIVLLLSLSFFNSSSSLNILGVFVYPSFQHWTVHNALITELSKRGHNLTVLTNFPTTESSSTYREVHVKPFYSPEIEVRDRLQLTNISDIRRLDPRKIIDIRFESGLSATRHFLASSTIQDFLTRLRAEQSLYDVMLVGDYYQEALLYLAELSNCPVIGLSPSVAEITSHYFLGLGALNVYRFHDLMMDQSGPADTSLALYANKKYLENYLPQQEALVKEYFQLPIESTVNFSNVYKRVLYVLTNTYSNYFHPPSPAITGKEIQVGGFWIRAPKELPRDIKDFLQDANYGAILVSLPSQVFGVSLDLDIISVLMKSLGGMRQKILFEWDGAKIPDLPTNVLVRRWIPMSDILAHPYVQLMVCPGDIWCIQNAIQRMVPLIGIPITKEQDLLMQNVDKAGYGKRLLLPDLTTESVTNLTKEMYGNQVIIQRIHNVASFYRTRPLGAMEEAAYWVEFAGKYRNDERIYKEPPFQGTAIIPPYTKIIALVGLSILAVVVLLAGAFFGYKAVSKGSGKPRDKKAV